MDTKIKLFTEALQKNNLDGFIVTNPTNIFYLSHFKGFSPNEREALLIFAPNPTLITARLYQNEARLAATRLAKKLESQNLKIKIADDRNQIFNEIKKILTGGLPTEALPCRQAGLAKVGFEEEDLKYAEYQKFKKILQNLNANGKLIPFKNLIEDLRAQKTKSEIAKIQKAQEISHLAFKKLLKTIKIGQTEQEIAEKLTTIIKTLGGSLAFESIVASGANSGLPHHITGTKKIKRGEVLLLDFGAKYKDYCADLSRTIFIGKAKDRHRNIYDHVLNTQKSAIGKIAHNLKSSEVFHHANNIFKKQKQENYFLHSLGHGVGLEIHEKPNLSLVSDDILKENMVFSIEPGLYFPWGGVRIEDLVVIKNGKAKILGRRLAEFIQIL